MSKVSEKLKAEYGEACIQAEIWNGKVMELKRKIAEELNRKEVDLKDVPQK